MLGGRGVSGVHFPYVITKDFPYVGGGVNQHMENSICFVVFIFESFPKIFLNNLVHQIHKIWSVLS